MASASLSKAEAVFAVPMNSFVEAVRFGYSKSHASLASAICALQTKGSMRVIEMLAVYFTL